jgi:hypothetical protein
MLIYDATSLAFIQKAEAFVKEILVSCGVTVRTSRFVFNRYLYPIHVVVFEGPELGHFNAPFLQIGLNRKLVYQAKDSVVRDILKHELAHYLTHILSQGVAPHGPEFRAVCARFGFPADVAAATMDLAESNIAKEGDLRSERVLEKVKKLLSLAQSSNAHEAELATVKANDLLLRHNLEYLGGAGGAEPIYLDRLLPRRRKDTKLSAIYSILKHFIVRPVISQGKDVCCLEVSGSLTNVKLAGYVAAFLDREFDHLWREAQASRGLRGLQAKNSFFLGVAEGYDQKMRATKEMYSPEERRSLVTVERNLERETQVIYRRLSQSRSGHQTDPEANKLGQERGRALSIRSAVEGTGKNLYLPDRRG